MNVSNLTWLAAAGNLLSSAFSEPTARLAPLAHLVWEILVPSESSEGFLEPRLKEKIELAGNSFARNDKRRTQ